MKLINIKDFIAIPDNKPFWGSDGGDSPMILVKEENEIFALNYDDALDPDEIEFFEYVKPMGWMPKENDNPLKDLEETIALADLLAARRLMGAKI